jgi:hypothetical protein
LDKIYSRKMRGLSLRFAGIVLGALLHFAGILPMPGIPWQTAGFILAKIGE